MPALEQAPVSTTAFSTSPGAWVIYRERSDHVWECYVARLFHISKVFIFETDEELRADTVNELRTLLPINLVNIGRRDSDTDDVIEMWI